VSTQSIQRWFPRLVGQPNDVQEAHRQAWEFLYSLRNQIAQVSAAIPPPAPTLSQIRNELQAGGSVPLDVTGLSGVAPSGPTVTIPTTSSSSPGAWTAYTPTWTSQAGTITPTLQAAYYQQIGKTVYCRGQARFTVSTTSSYVTFSLPVTARDAYQTLSVSVFETSPSIANAGGAGGFGSTTLQVVYPGYGLSFGAGPTTQVIWSGSYEAQ